MSFPSAIKTASPECPNCRLAIPTGLAARVRGIPMPHLSVLFSLYCNSAAHPRHVMSAFVLLLRHGERRRINHRLIQDPTTPASPVALRYDVT
jgi:hypothetical protein